MAYQFDFIPVLQNTDLLLRGALFTLELTAIGAFFGVGVGGCLAQQQAGKQRSEEGAVTQGHGKSPNRRGKNSANRQSTWHANIGSSSFNSTCLLGLIGLTGLNSWALFRTLMAHRGARPNPHGA